MKRNFTNKFFTLLVLFVCVAVSSTLAANIKASGVVKDEGGQPLIGAAVSAVGTTAGVITGIDGSFQITVAEGAQLNVAYIGYESTTLPAAAKMDVVLKTESKVMEEVVVIGYGAVRKKELTGAVTQVKADDLSKLNTSDLGSSMQGMVSGVSVTADSGAPGESANVVIRGFSSISGDNSPLYVVDGVPYEGNPNISPNEIETIDILKDVASSAIYGTRGAAGVILITTKRGSEGALNVKIDATVGMRNITSANYLMNSTEQTYFNLLKQRNVSTSENYYDDSTQIDLYKQEGYFYNNTNLLDEIFINNTLTQNYSANFSGGTKTLKYSLVLGYYDEEGSIINSGFDRFNTRLNLNYNKNKFSFAVNAGITSSETDVTDPNIITSAIKYSPLESEIDTSTGSVTSGSGASAGQMQSIIVSLNSKNNAKLRSSVLNFNAGYDITENLKYTARVGITTSHQTRKKFVPYYDVYNQEGELMSNPSNSYVQMTSEDRNSTTFDTGFTYKKSFNEIHNLTALVAITGEQYLYEGFVATKEGLSNNDLPVLNTGTINPAAESLVGYDNVLFGALARAQYNLKDRYFFSASIRRDGSSKFGKDNRWGWFPSASAAWSISEEPFFEPLSRTVKNFKLRGSYGMTGNQNFAAYSYAAYITSGLDYISVGSGESLELGSSQIAYANPDVKWETTKQYNIGIDLGLFNNRLTFTADYYRSDKSDMLFPVQLPGSAGTATKVTFNVGNMTNSGYEFAAQYHSKVGKVNYSLSGTFSSNDNVVTKISGNTDRYSALTDGYVFGAAAYSQVTYIAKDYEAGAFFLYETDGIINTDKELMEYKKIKPTAKMGDLKYVDKTGDNKITDLDRVYSGSGLPDYEIGFNVNANYAGFDLYVNIYSALGQEIVNGARATAFGYGRHKDLVAQYSQFNTDSKIPTYRGDLKAHANYAADTDVWVEDGSYCRIKNITLGYTLPDHVVSKAALSKVRFFLQVQNPFTFTKYTGYDPEVGGAVGRNGVDMGRYPSFTTYSAGLNLSF